MSHLEIAFAQLWVELFPSVDLHTEFKFHPKRRYRIDFAHIESRTGIEVNGSTWRKGGHSSGSGIQRDYEKQRLAALQGWLIVPLSASDVRDERVLREVKAIIDLRSNYAGN